MKTYPRIFPLGCLASVALAGLLLDSSPCRANLLNLNISRIRITTTYPGAPFPPFGGIPLGLGAGYPIPPVAGYPGIPPVGFGGYPYGGLSAMPPFPGGAYSGMPAAGPPVYPGLPAGDMTGYGYSPPAYAPYIYVSPASPPGPVADPQMNTVSLEVRVPTPEAEVWVSGALTARKGVVRTYISPPLVPGDRYAYEVHAQWYEQGQLTDQTRIVPVRAGDRLSVDFTIPAVKPES